MDRGGGGDAIQEILCQKKKGLDDRDVIWPIPDQLENKSDLGNPGRFILDIVNFSPNWISTAAHSVESAIERCELLFPYKGDDNESERQYLRHFQEQGIDDNIRELLQQDLWGIDEWESEKLGIPKKLGITQELNECINETCAIVRQVTSGGTEQFELPKTVNQPEGLDMRRRDRWSALMLAIYAARTYKGHGHEKSNVAGIATYRGSPLTHGLARRKGRVAF
jgi:hypothetical protein